MLRHLFLGPSAEAREEPLPSARISTPIERAQYVIHWQGKFKETDAPNVVQLVQDILHPRSFDDYVNQVFD